MEVGPIIHPLPDCVPDVQLEFFRSFVVPIGEECLESSDLDTDIVLELRAKLPGFGMDLRIDLRIFEIWEGKGDLPA